MNCKATTFIFDNSVAKRRKGWWEMVGCKEQRKEKRNKDWSKGKKEEGSSQVCCTDGHL